MDKNDSTTNLAEPKKIHHLRAEERGAIQVLRKQGLSNRAIARAINCNPSTVGYELRRGTPEYSSRGRRPGYSAKRGAAVYKMNRSRCRRSQTVSRTSTFIRWMVKMVRTHNWPFDTYVGRAPLERLFPKQEIPCTKTLYNFLWHGELPITLFELPEVLSRRTRRKQRIHKHIREKSIDEHFSEVMDRTIFGHWDQILCWVKNEAENQLCSPL